MIKNEATIAKPPNHPINDISPSMLLLSTLSKNGKIAHITNRIVKVNLIKKLIIILVFNRINF